MNWINRFAAVFLIFTMVLPASALTGVGLPLHTTAAKPCSTEKIADPRIQDASFLSSPHPDLYTGEQFDPDLGFYYLRARYNNPDSGRFWTMDSYEGDDSDPRTLHKYLYCHSNPINGKDPSGNMTLQEGVIAVGIIGIIAGSMRWILDSARNNVSRLQAINDSWPRDNEIRIWIGHNNQIASYGRWADLKGFTHNSYDLFITCGGGASGADLKNLQGEVEANSGQPPFSHSVGTATYSAAVNNSPNALAMFDGEVSGPDLRAYLVSQYGQNACDTPQSVRSNYLRAMLDSANRIRMNPGNSNLRIRFILVDGYEYFVKSGLTDINNNNARVDKAYLEQYGR